MNSKLKKLAVALLAFVGAFPSYAAGDATYPQLTNLPTVYIDTESGMDVTSKDYYITASLRWVDSTGVKTYENNLGIKGRGNSTWGMAKKPYRLKFDKKQKFLGNDRANSKSWTVLANFADKTLIRNAVAACIGTFAGQPFTAAAEFVDLVLNGQYLGNYQISDQMEIREKRIAITEQADSATAESNITGGYFLEVDGFGNVEPVYITTPRGVVITVKSPDEKIINQAQKDYILGHISAFENALFSADFQDPVKGYRKYIDAPTLASWYVATEFTGNVDGFWSTNIYKEKDDDKIYWGPLWDYDIAFNNCDRVGNVANSLMSDVGFGENLTRLWIRRMWEDPWFVHLVNDKWKQLVADGITAHVNKFIDETAAKLEQSQQRNFKKWPINQKVYNEIVLFNNYKDGISYLKNFISAHANYLTQEFQRRADANPLPPQPFELDTLYYYNITNKGCGKYVAPNPDGTGLAIFTPNFQDQTQEWNIVADGEYYKVINRSTKQALTDLAAIDNGYYVGGSQLGLSEANPEDDAQKWTFVPTAQNGTFCIVNKLTNLAWNNSAGNDADGNRVISWTNDAQNANKPTRQWTFAKASVREIEDPGTTAVEALTMPKIYQVSYLPAEQMLRFVCQDGELSGSLKVYTLTGALVLDAPIATEVNVSSLPAGTLILSWEIPGQTPQTVKFQK